MSLENLLGIINIIITLYVGFYLTHKLGVRDSRSRALKDFYIDELKGIHEELSSTFRNLKSGAINGEDFMKWYDTIDSKLEVFDTDLRKSFPIMNEKLSEVVFKAYRIITDAEDFNNQFSNRNPSYNAETSDIIAGEESCVYSTIHSLVFEINNSPRHGVCHRFIELYKKEWSFFTRQNNPKWSITKHWIKRLAYYAAIMIITLLPIYIVGRWLYNKYSNEKDFYQEKQIELMEKEVDSFGALNDRMDSVHSDLKKIKENMEVKHSVINNYIHTNCLNTKDSVQE